MRALAFALLLVVAGCGRVGYRQTRREVVDAPLDASSFDAAFTPTPDASRDAAAAVDVAVLSDTPCFAVAESCNGLDDDCDTRVDETFTRVASWDACSTVPRVGSVTLATYSWDSADALVGASIVEGGIEYASGLTTPGALLLDVTRTLGNLLVTPATGEPRFFAMPFVGGNAALEPNVNRVSLEVTFAEGWTAHDGVGDDLVVYEHGDPISEPEAFAVAVRDARTGVWSESRWEFFDAFADTDRVFATAYDIADFGLPGGVVDRVRIGSVFGVDASVPDRVDSLRGDGFLVRGGDPAWATASMLRLSEGGPGVAVGLLDADMLWVAALRPLVEPTCCVR